LHLGQAVQHLSGVVLIVWGVYLIAGGALSMGGLIACYMLNGRALAPLGQLSGLLTRYQQARLTRRNVDQMMALPQATQQGWAGGRRAGQVRGRRECWRGVVRRRADNNAPCQRPRPLATGAMAATSGPDCRSTASRPAPCR